MKNIKITRTFILSRAKEIIRDNMIRLESEKSLSSLMSTIGWRLITLALIDLKKIPNRIRLIHRFAQYLWILKRRHGDEFVVKYLKACTLCLSKFVANQPLASLRDLEPDLPLPRLINGLPAIIGTRDRRSLRSGNMRVMRMYTTLFSLYRIISIPGKLKLNTITDPFNGNPLYLKMLGGWFLDNSKSLIRGFKMNMDLQTHRVLFSEKSSPTNSTSWSGLASDAIQLIISPKVFASYCAYATLTKNEFLVKYIQGIASSYVSLVTSPNALLREACLRMFIYKPSYHKASEFAKENNIAFDSCIGQLSKKEEAAGKIRVFAMVDGWTQSLLKPLHDSLSSLLKSLPNDGTFQQEAAFKRGTEKAVKYNCCYGYDLSAATDRLPLFLQIQILGSIFGLDIARSWASILTDRDYWMIDQGKEGVEGLTAFKYAVGQPMGALSSFNMLGLTHHLLMQYCSKMVYRGDTWEERYEILGDDIIIFDHALASKYLEVMRNIGVPINESKSVVAVDKPVVEFAKRTWWNQEFSAFSFKQFLSSVGFKGRISVILGLFKKQFSIDSKVRPNFIANIVLKSTSWDKRPYSDPLAPIALVNSFVDIKNITWEYAIQLVKWTEPIVVKGKFSFANMKLNILKEVFSKAAMKHPLPSLPITDLGYSKFEKLIQELLVDKLIKMMKTYNHKYVGVKLEQISSYLLGGKLREIFISNDPFILVENKKIWNTIPTDFLEANPSYMELVRITKNMVRRHLMNGLSSWDDERLQEHVGYKTKISELSDYIELVNSRVAAYEIGDRLAYNYIYEGVSNIDKRKILSEFGASSEKQFHEMIKLWKDNHKNTINQDSTSLLKLIDKAYAKSLKAKKAAELASMHKYVVMNDVQSGFDAGAWGSKGNMDWLLNK